MRDEVRGGRWGGGREHRSFERTSRDKREIPRLRKPTYSRGANRKKKRRLAALGMTMRVGLLRKEEASALRPRGPLSVNARMTVRVVVEE